MSKQLKQIKIDLQVIMIIWGEEIEPLSSLSLSVLFLLHLFFFLSVYLGFFFSFLGGLTSLPPPLNPPVLDSVLTYIRHFALTR